MGYPLTARGNFAIQMRLPTTSIYMKTVCSLMGNRLLDIMKNRVAQCAEEWAANGLPMRILP